ncbi:unnamed protein product [marine sediment metagenome]|uniref:Uncharacterized protein n=1 Tax=marine sediment metagenome TaxID=412755 RepID=X1U1N1_9ZZZZ
MLGGEPWLCESQAQFEWQTERSRQDRYKLSAVVAAVVEAAVVQEGAKQLCGPAMKSRLEILIHSMGTQS